MRLFFPAPHLLTDHIARLLAIDVAVFIVIKLDKVGGIRVVMYVRTIFSSPVTATGLEGGDDDKHHNGESDGDIS